MISRETEQQAHGLVRALRGPDAAARVQAAIRLSELGSAGVAVVPELLGLLGHADSQVRRVATWVLGHLDSDRLEIRTGLERAMGDPDASVRRVARAALALADPRRAA